MKYFPAFDLELKAKEIIETLNMQHVQGGRIACLRSQGTSTDHIIARCHGLSKVQQLGLKVEPFYTIEFISENFDKMPEDERIKTIIHELMHIPHNFGGGFRHHDFVTRKSVDALFKKYKELSSKKQMGIIY